MDADFVVRKKKDFIGLVEEAKGLVQDRKFADEKWLRDPDERFGSYFKEFLAVKARRGASVYDIASGPGYLMWFLREFSGCDVRGLEPQQREDYRLLWNQLGFSDSIDASWIHPMRSVHYPATYDYITCTRICFDRFDGDPNRLWEPEAYRFFIVDACKHLNPGGELYLRFNVPPVDQVRDILDEFGSCEAPKQFRIRREKAAIELA